MTNILETVAEVLALDVAATAGPWEAWHGDDTHAMNCLGVVAGGCGHEYVYEEGHAQHTVALTLLQEPRYAEIGTQHNMGWWRWDENTQLIARYRTLTPELARAVMQLLEALLEIRDQAEPDYQNFREPIDIAQEALRALGVPSESIPSEESLADAGADSRSQVVRDLP